jgi:transcription elongation factor B subunit 1
MDGDDDNLDATSPYIKLISAENSEIYLLRRIALQVETLRVMLEGSFRESEEGIIRFPDISTSALEKVVQYLHYKDRYSNSASRIPEFVIDPEEVCTTILCMLFHVIGFVLHIDALLEHYVAITITISCADQPCSLSFPL